MRRIAGLLFVALVGVVAMPAQATPITFTFTSTDMSGTLGGNAFSDATMTVTATADTADLGVCFSGTVLSYAASCLDGILTGHFTLGGASGTFSDLLYVFDNQPNSVVGFGTGSDGDRLDVTIPGAGTYDMVSAFGPVSGAGSMAFGGDGTSLGALTASYNGSSVTTFSAVLDAVNVPEPGEPGLFGIGLLGLLGLALRRKGLTHLVERCRRGWPLHFTMP